MSAMKIGLQTMSWGQSVRLPDLFAAAQGFGYQGVEISQAVDALGSPSHLGQLLNHYDLRLASFGSGSLDSRMKYIKDLQPDYLYIDEWDEEPVRRALDDGYTIGFHPHLYKTIQTVRNATHYLDRFEGLGLILNTAHLYLAGEKILDVLKNHGSRVVAVHLRDWTGRYGRSPLRFARGFTALGQGDLAEDLKSALAYLLNSNYRGWIIVGQDMSQGNLLDCAEASRDWLRAQGL